jgi:hypothetical protein
MLHVALVDILIRMYQGGRVQVRIIEDSLD